MNKKRRIAILQHAITNIDVQSEIYTQGFDLGLLVQKKLNHRN
jgi:hypothetical protein